MKVDIYIKLSSHGNPKGEGKAAAIVEFIRQGKAVIRRTCTIVSDDTKNKLALSICINAMTILIKPCSITVHMDNRHIKYAMEQEWVKRWRENNWIKSNGDPPANIREWQQILTLSEIHKIKWEGYDGKYEDQLDEMLQSMEGKS